LDTTRNRLFVAFTTTGIVPGGSVPSPAPVSNLVVASIQTTGQLNWLQETPFFNEPQYRYSHIFRPTVTLDTFGSLYVAAQCTQLSTGQGMIAMFKLHPDTGVTAWAYTNSTLYRAYLPAINSVDTPNTAFRVGANYTAPAIGIQSGYLYVAFVNQDSDCFQLVALGQIQRYADITAFMYMRDKTSICC
jgi:outer membrane protein assembly factor BamB